MQEDMLIEARERREANSIREPISYDKFRRSWTARARSCTRLVR